MSLCIKFVAPTINLCKEDLDMKALVLHFWGSNRGL
jgi:hypothetical protein